jgi:hypothetical protein
MIPARALVSFVLPAVLGISAPWAHGNGPQDAVGGSPSPDEAFVRGAPSGPQTLGPLPVGGLSLAQPALVGPAEVFGRYVKGVSELEGTMSLKGFFQGAERALDNKDR